MNLETDLVVFAGAALTSRRLGLAEALFEEVLSRFPNNPDAHNNLGLIRLDDDDDRLDDAIAHFRAATKLKPDWGRAWSNLAKALTRKGRMSDYEMALERALQIEPDNREVRRNLAAILIDNHNAPEAKRHCQILKDRVDDDPKLLTELGILLFHMGDLQGSSEAFDKARDLEPTHSLATIGKAVCEFGFGNTTYADALFEQGLQGLPKDGDVAATLVGIFGANLPRRSLKRLIEEAIELTWDDPDVLLSITFHAYAHRLGAASLRGFQRLSTLVPERPGISSSLLDTQLSMCEWVEVNDLGGQLRRDVQETIANKRPLLIDVWNLFAAGVDYPVLASAARYKSKQIYDSYGGDRIRAGFTFAPRTKDKIRIGYLCPYTHKSSHIDNLYTVVSRHDRARFEVYGYSIQAWKGDSFDRSFRSLFDKFSLATHENAAESAQLIYDDEIDILIDTTGHFAANCMNLAAMRPAPVIVHGAAGFNIIGVAPYYDYSLNDRTYLTDELASLYLEKPFYMPHCAMPAELLPMDSRPLTRAEAQIPEDVFVFTDFNHPCKYDLNVFSAWMEILRQVPDSVLLLGRWMDDADVNLRKFAVRSGVAPDRLLFAQTVARPTHLRRLQLCDLALDTYYH